MNAEKRIADEFPNDWEYYTLGFPVALYKHLSVDDSIDEVDTCHSGVLLNGPDR